MEIKKEIFKRVPPGDRWVEIGASTGDIHISLTNALEHYFQQNRVRQYYIDAAVGYIYKVEEVEDPVLPPQTYSLYGEDY
jgi:hypothetical protein